MKPFLLSLLVGSSIAAADVASVVKQELPSLVTLYKELHTNPELSLHETETAARIAKELREAGLEVTENVGGHGVVGVLKNGDGPVILVRTDLDALPVKEQTEAPYASKKVVKDDLGREVNVMHACGLIHKVTSPDYTQWLTASEVLHAATLGGARTALIGHDTGSLEAGKKADLSLVVADEPAAAAGVFTLNVMCAAPVTYCKDVLAKKGAVKAVRAAGGGRTLGLQAAFDLEEALRQQQQ